VSIKAEAGRLERTANIVLQLSTADQEDVQRGGIATEGLDEIK
jgi:hypothetical protein